MEDIYYTIRLTWVPSTIATPWHPTDRTGPFAVLRSLGDSARRALAGAIAAACASGDACEIEIDMSEIENLAAEGAESDVDEVYRESKIEGLRVAQRSCVGWDDSARSANAHRHAGVPDVLSGVYYAAYAVHGNHYADGLIADHDAATLGPDRTEGGS